MSRALRALGTWALAVLAGLPAAGLPAVGLAADAVPAGDRMVLIASAASPVTSLDAIDLKRVFLGVPIVAGGRNVHALLNESDPRLVQVFLQHVVGMSRPIYERRLLQLTMEQGRRMPPSFGDDGQLIAALLADPTAVSYAWASSVGADPRLRVVRELWRQ